MFTSVADRPRASVTTTVSVAETVEVFALTKLATPPETGNVAGDAVSPNEYRSEAIGLPAFVATTGTVTLPR